MQFLKNRFLTLSIDRQVQIGIIGVTFCVNALVFLVIFINTFILLNMTYADILTILDKKENQQLEKVALFVDLSNLNIVENTQFSIQWIRNFISNNRRNYDFVNNWNNIEELSSRYLVDLNNINSNKNYSTLCMREGYSDCVFYRGMDQESEDFRNLKKVFLITMPILRKTFYHRHSDDTVDPLFKRISYYNIKTPSIFLYVPQIDKNIWDIFEKNYGRDDINNYLRRVAISLGNFYYDFTIPYSGKMSYNYTNLNSTINWSPYLQVISPLEVYSNSIKLPFVNSFQSDNEMRPIIATTSPIYNENLYGSKENISNPNFLVDSIQGDWSTTMLDNGTNKLVKRFKGVKFIGVSEGDNYLITLSHCYWLLKFYDLINNTTVFDEFSKEPPVRIWDCVIPPLIKSRFIQKFNITSKFDNVIAKLWINLFDSKSSNKSTHINKLFNTENNVLFKIFMFQTPDISNYILFNSNFLTSACYNLYILKNMKFFENKIYSLDNLIRNYILRILFFDLIILYLSLITMTIIVLRITSQITQPINNLVMRVKNFGKGHLHNEKEKKENFLALEKINYPDDKDINALFQICKNLLKGGFIEKSSNRKPQKDWMLMSYNNISYVKSNNLIIIEDAIKSRINGNYTIFNWSQDSKVNENEYEKEFTNIPAHSDNRFSLLKSNSESFFRNLNESSNINTLKNENNQKINTSILYSDQNLYNSINIHEKKMKKSYVYDLFMKITGDDFKSAI